MLWLRSDASLGFRNFTILCVVEATDSCLEAYGPFGCLRREFAAVNWTGAWPYLGLPAAPGSTSLTPLPPAQQVRWRPMLYRAALARKACVL